MARLNKQQLAALSDSVTGIGWANTNQACVYSGITKPTLDKWLKDGLQHSRIGRLVRIKYTDIDEYLRGYRDSCPELSLIADRAVRGL